MAVFEVEVEVELVDVQCSIVVLTSPQSDSPQPIATIYVCFGYRYPDILFCLPVRKSFIGCFLGWQGRRRVPAAWSARSARRCLLAFKLDFAAFSILISSGRQITLVFAWKPP